MLAALRRQYPQATIHLIADNRFGAESILGNSHNQFIDGIHYLKADANWLQKMLFFIALRRQKYDYLLLPFDADRRFLRVGAIIAGIKHLIRHRMAYDTPIAAHNIPKANNVIPIIKQKNALQTQYLVALLPNRHEIDLNLDLLKALKQLTLPKINAGIDNYFDDTTEVNKATFVHYEPQMSVLTHYQIIAKQYIVIQPGAANGLYAAKVWSAAKFKDLINALLQNYPFPIILVGDAGDERVFVAPIAATFAHEPRLINTAGTTDFQTLLTLLANARLLICHDSGIMHLADALNTQLIALYGPTDYMRTHPRRATSHTLVSDTPYKQIMHYLATDEAMLAAQGIGHVAMDGISVEMLMGKIKSII